MGPHDKLNIILNRNMIPTPAEEADLFTSPPGVRICELIIVKMMKSMASAGVPQRRGFLRPALSTMKIIKIMTTCTRVSFASVAGRGCWEKRPANGATEWYKAPYIRDIASDRPRSL